MSAKKVFISYSHDSENHSDRVLALAWALRNNGIDVELDQFHNEEIVDWPRWCRQQIKPERSDFVLCICTAEYRRRIEGGVPPEKGKGVYWEGSLLDDEIYDDKRNRRMVPVLFDGEPESSILDFLRGWTFCRLSEFTLSDGGYEHLLRILTNQAKVEKNVVGTVPVLPTRRAPVGSMSSPTTSSKADISRIIKYAPAELIGRESETKLLNDSWERSVRGEPKRPHVLTFVALGGEGKTSLVAKWAADLAYRDWPGCEAVFAWSFYSQGTREQVAASSDLFLKETLTFFGDDADKEFAASPAGAFEKGQRLARIVGQRRSLLILDGLEPLQYAPTSPTPGELKDAGLAALLRGLATASYGVCVVTTRYSLPDLKAFWQTTAPEEKLLRLSRKAGVHLLKSFNVRGSDRKNIPFNNGKELLSEFENLVEDVKGHALTLNLLGSYLRDAHGGDIRKHDLIDFADADAANEHKHHVVHVMDAYVRWLSPSGFRAWTRRLFSQQECETQAEGKRGLAMLQLLGLFDRPVTDDCLGALLKAPAISGLTEPLVKLTEAQRNTVLKRLEETKLLTVNGDAAGALVSLDTHPHLREYFARQLRAQQPDAWRAAHQRLYEHLCTTTPDKDEPTLEDLQPLYQAVSHGCQAGLQKEACEEVYYARIARRNENYSAFKLGAIGSDLGAEACFFELPWKRISPALSEVWQAWMLNEAGFRLRSLGRLTEALEPLRASQEMCVQQENWKQAAIRASNLSELELTLGEVAGAVGDAEQSVTYADRSGDAFQRESKRATHADALHQAGRRAEAETRLREAEQMQAERQPADPLLPSLSGFRYCDLLLAAPERAAWQMMLELKTQNSKLKTPIEYCRTVSQRAAQTIKIAERNNWLLDIALNHLILSHAALYEVVLAMGGLPFKIQPSQLKTSIEAAVVGLRRSGDQDVLPKALLTRGWLRSLTGARTGPESAQDDLDEAWEIAERGPMRLFMADIHLYRARLFHALKPYPWAKDADGNARGPKDDLAAARKLIEQCGYWRRKEELEDAEEAAKSW